MKGIKFIVEKTNTGYSAYAENFDKYPVSTTGHTYEALRKNILNSLNTFLEYKKKPIATLLNIETKMDLSQFFDFYKEINAKAMGQRIGMNQTLLSQYVNGKKKPSGKQVDKIINGLKSLGRELQTIDFV